MTTQQEVLARIQQISTQLEELRRVVSGGQVDTTLAFPSHQVDLQTSPATTAEMALWSRANDKFGGVITLRGSGVDEFDLNVLLFSSAPNDRGLLLNGYILPKTQKEGSLKDIAVGSIFVNVENGSRVVVAKIFATAQTNELSFRGVLTPVNGTKENSPVAKAVLSCPTPILKQGVAPMVEEVKAPDPVAESLFSVASNNFSIGNSIPSDPITQGHKPEVPSAVSDLFGGSGNDAFNIGSLLG